MSFFRITLHRSAIGLPERTRGVLAALGLRKRTQTVFHPVSPQFAGDERGAAAGEGLLVGETCAQGVKQWGVVGEGNEKKQEISKGAASGDQEYPARDQPRGSSLPPQCILVLY
ncbi:hypothetical protein SUNI508_01636 [Seiridium unicorne]|uniref:Large ribosomal subunit protein uL30m n=1 Tax=Seiridium unicorne TaxID=138068 RepID=A0ABR2UPH3_9PEZI